MAGYLFSLDSIDSLVDCIKNGIYGTKLSEPKGGNWRLPHEGTFGDYSTMKKGDNVYFFIQRKIYGIGTLINIEGDCKFFNFANAGSPTIPSFDDISDEMLLKNKEGANIRFVCVFEPSPHFFLEGVDMDEVLSSAPEKFKTLRVFWKLSFIKFSDEENTAFKSIILRRNIQSLLESPVSNTFTTNFTSTHNVIREKIRRNRKNYQLDNVPFLSKVIDKNGSIRHEMAIEASILHKLSINDKRSTDIFGSWDYLTHQVVASPFKPVDYMDKIDIFGYRYIPNENPLIAKFLIVEIKKGAFNMQDLHQLMKYVDWVKNEYAFGDYSIIEAFAVAYEYDNEVLENFEEIIKRKYIYGFRPSKAAEWSDVKLISYTVSEKQDISFYEKAK